ncbi:hypothetical protein SEA_MURP_34 [Gordonia phage Murp]|nr:hypothetical protein SEA_MURP_34 [Gordonia phage Murp]
MGTVQKPMIFRFESDAGLEGPAFDALLQSKISGWVDEAGAERCTGVRLITSSAIDEHRTQHQYRLTLEFAERVDADE